MKTIFPALLIALAAGCKTAGIEDVKIVNDDAVYKLGENTVIENVQYQTDDGEWLTYDKPILFPKGFYIGKGPEED